MSPSTQNALAMIVAVSFALVFHPEYARCAETQRGYAPIDGGRLYYEIRGSGPPVVLIHGGNMDSRMWDDQFAAFARQFRVIRYDVRNFGRSSVATGPYSSIDDLSRLLLYLKIQKPCIIGLSLGGRIAIDFTISHPNSVRALVLAAPGLSGYAIAANSPARLQQLRDAVQRRDDKAVVDWWLSGPYLTAAMERPELARRIRDIVQDNAAAWFVSVDESPLSPPAVNRLSEIRVPTLTIVGSRDVDGIKRITELIAADVPGAVRQVIEGAGHLINMENPDKFNKLAVEFLSRH